MKKIKKLSLNKETIAVLDRDSLRRVKGGLMEDDAEEIADSEDAEAAKTRRVCGTSRSGRVCISLTPCGGCQQ